MLSKLRLTAAVICLLVFPAVLYASVPREVLVASQLSGDWTAETAHEELVEELVRQQFCALGVPDSGAVALADAASHSGMIAAFHRAIQRQPEPVPVHSLLDDPAVREAMQLCQATLSAEGEEESSPPDWEDEKAAPKVGPPVGSNADR